LREASPLQQFDLLSVIFPTRNSSRILSRESDFNIEFVPMECAECFGAVTTLEGRCGGWLGGTGIRQLHGQMISFHDALFISSVKQKTNERPIVFSLLFQCLCSADYFRQFSRNAGLTRLLYDSVS